MLSKRIALGLALGLAGFIFAPAGAEISAPAAAGTPEAAYNACLEAIHKASKAAQLPTFAHTSPLNVMKMADSKEEEKDMLEAFKEMTPHSLKVEGKIEFDGRTYLFFEGDPSESVKKKEYFPVLVEMVKEDGQWRMRRQQSWHVKPGTKEAELILRGSARVKRYQELFAAIAKPAAATRAIGTIDGKHFKPTNCYFIGRDGYFKLGFVDGNVGFAVYVRDERPLHELQGKTIVVNPLDGQKCDVTGDIILGPYAAKISFGKLNRGAAPATISLQVFTPFAANLNGTFFAEETEPDALTPDYPARKTTR